jgi:hypothetical protein
MRSDFMTTRRTAGQRGVMLARIAQAAGQIAAACERFGPEEPWEFADPSRWKCGPCYCAHHARCPAGSGLGASDSRCARADDTRVV